MKKKELTKEQRLARIIARGEQSGHTHVITGDVEIIERDGKKFIVVGDDSNAVLKHIMETEWMNGEEKWSGEHTDISLKDFPSQVRHGDVYLELVGDKTYQYIQQNQYCPYDKAIVVNKD